MIDALLIRGARVCAPADLGPSDVLVVAGRVAAVAPRLDELPLAADAVPEIDARGALLLPALVDQHCHVIGGGGGGGPASQGMPLLLGDLTEAGIGTAVSPLGHDSSLRGPEPLLARVRALTAQGLDTYMLTGEIGHPPATLTGSLRRDLALIPDVVGVKASVGEATGIRTAAQLADTLAQVLRGSAAAGKRPLLHLHAGLATSGLALVHEVAATGLADPGVVTVTHVNWSPEHLAAAAELAGLGVNLDLTACIRPDFFPGTVTCAAAVAELLERGVALERLSISSDAGGAHDLPPLPATAAATPSPAPVVHTPALLLDALRDVVRSGTLDLWEAAGLVTRNPAERLGLAAKGRIAPGAAADLLLLDADLRGPQRLWIAGREHVTDGRHVRHDLFEPAVARRPSATARP